MRASTITGTMQQLTVARENVRKLTEALEKAKGMEARAEKMRDKVALEKAAAWTKKVQGMLSAASLKVSTLEVQIDGIKDKAKGCVTPSGKRIRV